MTGRSTRRSAARRLGAEGNRLAPVPSVGKTIARALLAELPHIPLPKWVLAMHLLCASKRGMSGHQLHRMLGVSYKTAWFMAHRLRAAMASADGGSGSARY